MSICQIQYLSTRLWTDFGRSVGVTTVTPLVWLNRFIKRSTFPITAPQQPCNQKDIQSLYWKLLHFYPILSYILHPASYILHPASYILHPVSYIQHPTSYIQHPTSYIQHPTSSIQHPTSSILHKNSIQSYPILSYPILSCKNIPDYINRNENTTIVFI